MSGRTKEGLLALTKIKLSSEYKSESETSTGSTLLLLLPPIPLPPSSSLLPTLPTSLYSMS